MKHTELTEKGLDLLSDMNELVLGDEYQAVRRIIKLAATDIQQENQSVQFVMNKYYNSIYQLVFRTQLKLPEEFAPLLKEAQQLSFKNGSAYAQADMRMALYQ